MKGGVRDFDSFRPKHLLGYGGVWSNRKMQEEFSGPALEETLGGQRERFLHYPLGTRNQGWQ